MKELSAEKYKKQFEKNNDDALERAWLNRDFEISHYWKRAAYFWTFIAADFAGYFALVNSVKYQTNESQVKLELIIICLGYIFSIAWLLANLGSKKWQQNWENHIIRLEDNKTGPLYKTVISKRSYSVSRINIRVNLVVLIIWILIGWEFFYERFSINLEHVDFFTTATLTVTLVLSLDMIIGGGRSGFRYFRKKSDFFIDYQNIESMNGKIKIKAALKSDSMEGWGWISEKLISENGFYRIQLNSRKTICYLRIIDNNFIKNYNEGNTINIHESDNVIILNEHYRNQLGISDKNLICDLKIDKCNRFMKLFSFDYSHPNPYVRQNSRLTILSIILGVISLGFTLWTIYSSSSSV